MKFVPPSFIPVPPPFNPANVATLRSISGLGYVPSYLPVPSMPRRSGLGQMPGLLTASTAALAHIPENAVFVWHNRPIEPGIYRIQIDFPSWIRPKLATGETQSQEGDSLQTMDWDQFKEPGLPKMEQGKAGIWRVNAGKDDEKILEGAEFDQFLLNGGSPEDTYGAQFFLEPAYIREEGGGEHVLGALKGMWFYLIMVERWEPSSGAVPPLDTYFDINGKVVGEYGTTSPTTGESGVTAKEEGEAEPGDLEGLGLAITTTIAIVAGAALAAYIVKKVYDYLTRDQEAVKQQVALNISQKAKLEAQAALLQAGTKYVQEVCKNPSLTEEQKRLCVVNVEKQTNEAMKQSNKPPASTKGALGQIGDIAKWGVLGLLAYGGIKYMGSRQKQEREPAQLPESTERTDNYSRRNNYKGCLACAIKKPKRTNNPTVASVVLEQMGGMGAIKAMTGAYNFIDTGNGVRFRYKKMVGAKGNYVEVTLDPDDTYTMEIGSIRGTTYKTNYRQSGLYWDQLKPEFERATGLRLGVPKVIGLR